MKDSRAAEEERPPPLHPNASMAEQRSFLATENPSPPQRRAAIAVTLVTFAAFVLTSPFATIPLPTIWAFLPLYQSAFIVITLITAILLLSQLRILPSWGILTLYCGYLFSAMMAATHVLSFPGLFSDTGWLGAGSQTTAWLYFLWHGGFPLFVAAYALLPHNRLLPTKRLFLVPIPAATLAVSALVCTVTAAAVLAHSVFPEIMHGQMDGPLKRDVAIGTWLISFGALILLWRRRPHTLLDLWLMVVVVVWIFDSALAAVLNHGRFDIGWYSGRFYGLAASSLILIILLVENDDHYLQMIRIWMKETRDKNELLQQVEGRFRATFEQAAMGMALVSPDGRWLYANQTLCDIVGYTHDELLTKTFQDITHPEDLDTDLDRVRRMLAREIPSYSMEKRYIRKDGSLIWIKLTAALVWTGDGQPDYFVSVIEDITDLVEARNRILDLNTNLERHVAERTAELTAANQELDSFAYAVSHDLRAPLRAMSGFSQALIEDFGPQLNDQAKGYLDQIDIASRRMGALIDGILALSRSTRGDLLRESIDISAMADRLLRELDSTAEPRGTAWTVEPGLRAVGDARMVEALLRNLLGNAWKYTARSPQATIRVFAGAIDEVSGICVADNGAGFDMAHANRLFQPFQRLHRQDEFPGLGIGLATVQRIVHRHGGAIRAQGSPGHGAIFCFSLSPSSLPPQEQP